ncbi:sulfate anion transporter 1 [Rhinatrema bivittatum]|uniref:sulfate anion transporter 1 n=1 Tax=Rhinatrema bivittatum TaxID=194408 RepID=UPI00112DD488|nr:sulfate anion transporter 1 [Rhinatrema bivittatum]XP_029458178.1 sulfate anion transporter 1 [Rhinatrema bivittatum]XP_029458186.1 sulfate anion transporter 1 [Rhinatrema bivittatum]
MNANDMEREIEAIQLDKHPSCQIVMERKACINTNLQDTVKIKLKNNCFCTTKRLKNMFIDFFPIIRWLPKYNCKEYIWGDVMSGLIIGIILIPQAIAYSLLAGLKPIYSLYTSFFANLIYFLLGTSRHISVGIFSLLSLMVGQVVDRELQLAGFDMNDDTQQTISNTSKWITDESNFTTFNISTDLMIMECGKECYAISVATALTFLAGVYQVLMGVFHLGFLSMYLSEPMLDGFATGASLMILTAQVKYLLGIKIPRSQGYGMIISTWINIFKNIYATNFCDVLTSAICIAVLVTAKELGDRYKQKLKVPLPTELIVIVVATLISHFGNLNHVYGTSVSGSIPTGFIPPKMPDIWVMPRVAGDAVPLAVVSFAFTISLSEMFAKKYEYTVKANQEMFAIGFCNIIPSFFHSFASSAALAKTLVKASTGCKTQVSSVVSAVVVLLVLLLFAPLFYSLQKCVLACIIIVSLREALWKFKDLPTRWHLSKVDCLVWCVTVLSSAFISTEMGLLVGVIFSMMCIIARLQVPHTALLSQIQNTVFYEDDGKYENLCPVPQVKIFRFEAPIYYANKGFFLQSLYKMTGLDPALEIIRRKKNEVKEKTFMKKGNKEIAAVKGNNKTDTNVNLVPAQLDFHTIILDCSSIPFLDTTGVNTLKGILKGYKEVDISIILSCCNPSVIDSLERSGYFGKDNKDIHELHFYSVHSAVHFARERKSIVADTTI